ncbi:MAG: GlsB/YeaQ/YmgE family stress response membrane protein [Bryobacteraceae bacterium]
MLMPGRDPGGFIITILLGVAGSFVGSWLGRTLGLYSYGESAGFLMSIIGAMVILWLYRLIVKSRAG